MTSRHQDTRTKSQHPTAPRQVCIYVNATTAEYLGDSTKVRKSSNQSKSKYLPQHGQKCTVSRNLCTEKIKADGYVDQSEDEALCTFDRDYGGGKIRVTIKLHCAKFLERLH